MIVVTKDVDVWVIRYSKPGAELQMDFFLDDSIPKQLRSKL